VLQLKILITETQIVEGVTKATKRVKSPQPNLRCLCGAALEQTEDGKLRCPEEGILYVIPPVAYDAHPTGYH